MMFSRVFPRILLISSLTVAAADAASGRLPAGWPADAAPPDEARIVMSSISQWSQSLAFELPAPEDRALADVAAHLQGRGWATEYSGRVGKRQTLRYTNLDGRRMTVLAHETLTGSTAVLVTIYIPEP